MGEKWWEFSYNNHVYLLYKLLTDSLEFWLHIGCYSLKWGAKGSVGSMFQ